MHRLITNAALAALRIGRRIGGPSYNPEPRAQSVRRSAVFAVAAGSFVRELFDRTGKVRFRSIRGVGPLCANYDALSMFTMCFESAKRLKPTQLIRLTSGELDDNSNG